MSNYVPTFKYNPNRIGEVYELDEFYDRLFEFIYDNLTLNYNTTVLCYLEDETGHLNEATLERPGFHKSLLKCMDFYQELEQYERCNKIKELIKEYEL